MASVIFDELNVSSQPSLPSRVLPNDRGVGRSGPRNKVLRLDSPTTVQACQDLGIFLNDLKQKTLEDFKDPKVPEQIVEVRFKHYLNRYNQTVKDVIAKKKELARRIRNSIQQLDQQQPESPKNRTLLNSYHIAPYRTLNTQGSPLSPKTSFFPTSPIIPSRMVKSFNKTLSYFKKSMDSADITNGEQLLGIEESYSQSPKSSVEKFRKTLSDEVFKFNKIKEQKQREAKLIYEEELRLCQKKEEMREKEKSRDEKMKKIMLERKKKEIEQKRLKEEKAEKIKDIDRNFRLFKEEEKERNELRLEEVRRKHQEENEESRRKQMEKGQQIEIRRKQVKEKKQKLIEDEIRAADQLKLDIIGKLSTKENNYHMVLNEKSLRATQQLSKIEEIIDRYTEKQKQDKKENVHKIVSKIVKKEELVRALSEQHVKNLKRKEHHDAEKEKRLTSNQFYLDEKQKNRKDEINERFRKVEENLEVKRERDEQKRQLKQELNKLKIDDKLENHARLQRQLQNESLKIIEKEKLEEERILLLKAQKDLVQEAKREAALQSIIGKQKKSNSIHHLTRLVSSSQSTRVVNDHQKKLLKHLLRPSDYHQIEEQERKKEAERKAQLEQLENGTLPRKALSLSYKPY